MPKPNSGKDCKLSLFALFTLMLIACNTIVLFEISPLFCADLGRTIGMSPIIQQAIVWTKLLENKYTRRAPKPQCQEQIAVTPVFIAHGCRLGGNRQQLLAELISRPKCCSHLYVSSAILSPLLVPGTNAAVIPPLFHRLSTFLFNLDGN